MPNLSEREQGESKQKWRSRQVLRRCTSLTYLHAAADFYCLPTLLTITKTLCTLAADQHCYTYQRRPALRALESFQWGHSQFSSLRPISVLRHYPSTSSSLVSRSHSLSFFNLLLPFSLFLLFPLSSTRTCWLNCLWQAPHPFAILFYNPSNVCIHFIWCDCKVRKKSTGAWF